jgi:hypothetical protein
LKEKDMDAIEEYKYLWDGSEPDWVLYYINPSESEDKAQFAIFNIQTRRALIIEDDYVSQAVITKMCDAGVRVIRSLDW